MTLSNFKNPAIKFPQLHDIYRHTLSQEFPVIYGTTKFYIMLYAMYDIQVSVADVTLVKNQNEYLN